LYASMEEIEIGAQLSTWISSKNWRDLLVLEEYFRRFCLAKAQASQIIVEGEEISGWSKARSFKMLSDGWQSLICHKLQGLALLMRVECGKKYLCYIYLSYICLENYLRDKTSLDDS